MKLHRLHPLRIAILATVFLSFPTGCSEYGVWPDDQSEEKELITYQINLNPNLVRITNETREAFVNVQITCTPKEKCPPKLEIECKNYYGWKGFQEEVLPNGTIKVSFVKESVPSDSIPMYVSPKVQKPFSKAYGGYLSVIAGDPEETRKASFNLIWVLPDWKLDLGSSALTKTVRLLNLGTGPATLTSINLVPGEGTGEEEFTVSKIPALPRALGPSSTIAFNISFAPGEPVGEKNAKVYVSYFSGPSNDPVKTTKLIQLFARSPG
jgi:hypothetical protein